MSSFHNAMSDTLSPVQGEKYVWPWHVKLFVVLKHHAVIEAAVLSTTETS